MSSKFKIIEFSAFYDIPKYSFCLGLLFTQIAASLFKMFFVIDELHISYAAVTSSLPFSSNEEKGTYQALSLIKERVG